MEKKPVIKMSNNSRAAPSEGNASSSSGPLPTQMDIDSTALQDFTMARAEIEAMESYMPGNILGPPRVEDRANRSAIDCLIMVVRALYDCSGYTEKTRSNHLKENESRNPLMRIAWSEYQSDTDGKLRDEMTAILEQGSDQDASPYHRLSESEAMLDTIWYWGESKMWSSVMKRQVHRSDMGVLTFGEWEDMTESGECDPVKQGLIDYAPAELQQGGQVFDLTRAISDQFGTFKRFNVETFHVQMVASDNTRFIRVRYTPDPSHPQGFAELCRFKAQGLLMPCNLEPQHDYRLIAAVQMRREPDGNDRVRLFSMKHQPIPITPSGSVMSEDAPYLSADWHVGDPGHVYMLYYSACDFERVVVPGDDIPSLPTPSTFQTQTMEAMDAFYEAHEERLNSQW